MTFTRLIEADLRERLEKPFVHILFGARQTGKSSLIRALIPNPSLIYDFSDPMERTRLLADPGIFIRECHALVRREVAHDVVVDEAQNVPAIFDAVQHLYDRDKMRWRFILLGSSARKLRRTGANLLPGRALLHRLMPLTLMERPPRGGWEGHSPLRPAAAPSAPLFPETDLIERLAFGELPGIATLPEDDRTDLLKSYATIYLEEEKRYKQSKL